MVVSLAGISMSLLVCPLNSETKLSYSVRYILNKELKRDGGGGRTMTERRRGKAEEKLAIIKEVKENEL